MLFNTLDFGLFLIVVLALYHALPFRGQNVLLLLASYFFYGVWDWRFAGLLLLSSVIDYALTRAMERTDDARRRKRLLLCSAVVNLGILGFFKYFGFFVESFAALLARFGLEVPALALHVVLPVGVSFYAFQELSYTIDVYRRQLPAARNPLDFFLFVSFFPQLVAGPIERAGALLPQIQRPRHPTWEQMRSGTWLILWGTFKKVVIADNLTHLVDAVFDPGARPVGLEAWLAAYGFTLQIYCDFSAYSDIARGSARLLGFELMKNFDLPYFATNLRDLWRRWHISLSSWLRDYLYIPLGGNRGGRRKHYRNLMVTMSLCGLWHGAAWTFVAWGVLHGLCLMCQHALQPWIDRLAPRGRLGTPLGKLAGLLFTFHLWCLLFVVFRAQSLRQAWSFARLMFSDLQVGMSARWLGPFLLLVVPLLVIELWQVARSDHEAVLKASVPLRTLVYCVLLAGIVLLGEDHGKPFIYFQF